LDLEVGPRISAERELGTRTEEGEIIQDVLRRGRRRRRQVFISGL